MGLKCSEDDKSYMTRPKSQHNALNFFLRSPRSPARGAGLCVLAELLKEAITKDAIFATIRKKGLFQRSINHAKGLIFIDPILIRRDIFFRNCNYFLSINDILVGLQSYCLLANFRLTNMLLQPKMHFYAI